jgi:hypothetical protein
MLAHPLVLLSQRTHAHPPLRLCAPFARHYSRCTLTGERSWKVLASPADAMPRTTRPPTAARPGASACSILRASIVRVVLLRRGGTIVVATGAASAMTRAAPAARRNAPALSHERRVGGALAQRVACVVRPGAASGCSRAWWLCHGAGNCLAGRRSTLPRLPAPRPIVGVGDGMIAGEEAPCPCARCRHRAVISIKSVRGFKFPRVYAAPQLTTRAASAGRLHHRLGPVLASPATRLIRSRRPCPAL